MAWKRVSGILGSLQRIQRYLQLGLLMTEQVQSLSSLTIQQLASMSRVDENSTFSLALVWSLSSGSGKAFPTDSCLTPLRQQTLSTLMVPSVLREYVATVFSQFLSKQKGMTACSYQGPRYLATSTQGTVLGGFRVRLEMSSTSMLASCQARSPKMMGTRMSAALLIFLYDSRRFGVYVQLGNKKRSEKCLKGSPKISNYIFSCPSCLEEELKAVYSLNKNRISSIVSKRKHGGQAQEAIFSPIN